MNISYIAHYQQHLFTLNNLLHQYHNNFVNINDINYIINYNTTTYSLVLYDNNNNLLNNNIINLFNTFFELINRILFENDHTIETMNQLNNVVNSIRNINIINHIRDHFDELFRVTIVTVNNNNYNININV
jgi:hypothetical protein